MTRIRLELMLLPFVVMLVLGMSGCATVAPDREVADPVRAKEPPAQQETTKPAEPVVTTIAVDDFASPEESWYDTIASVTIRGSDLIVRVKPGTTEAQIAEIAAVAEGSRKRGLDVNKYSILYDGTGYMGKYGAIY